MRNPETTDVCVCDEDYFRSVVARAATLEAPLYLRLSEVASDHRWEKVAIADGDSTLTYGELVTFSSAFCAALEEAGLRRGEALGVALRNSKEFLVAAFGCWKFGAALVPVNPQLHETDIEKYIQDIGIRAFVTSEKDG